MRMTHSCSQHIALLLAILLAVLAGPRTVEAGEKVVTAWSYYNFPPFVVEEGKGLTQDFMALLNARAKGRFFFDLEAAPRKRVDLELENRDPAIVLFVNWAWMSDPEKEVYLWTPSLWRDRNVVAFSAASKREYTGPESLRGLTLGGVFGRKYKGLEPMIARGEILRADSYSEKLNVRKLAGGRIDVMTAPATIMEYLIKDLGVEEKVHVSENPLFEYTRHILVKKGTPGLHEFLDQFVRSLPNDPKWKELTYKYYLYKMVGQKGKPGLGGMSPGL